MKPSWTRCLPALFRERVEGRASLQQAIGNTGWLFADNILRMAVGFFVGVWITRYLGPERFGQLSYAIAFVLLFSSLAQLGLDGIVVRDLVREPSRRDEILGSAFVLKLAGGTAAALLAVAAIVIIRPGDDQIRLLVGITALGLIFQAFGAIDLWFQSRVRSKHAALARMIALLISSAARIALILCHAPLAAFIWAGIAEIFLCSLGFVVAYQRHGHRLRNWRASVPLARALLRDSWPLILAELVMMIHMRVDKIMIGDMAGTVELGIYAVAALLAESLGLIPRALASSFYPFILEAQRTDERLFRERQQKFYNLMALCAYAVAVPVSLLAAWGVPLLFGAPYARASSMLAGLVWTGVFINLGLARSNYLTAMNWTRLHFILDLTGCAANVALNLLLIPRYGGMGAVIAAVLGYGLAAYGTCFMFKPLRPSGFMMTKALLYPKIW